MRLKNNYTITVFFIIISFFNATYSKSTFVVDSQKTLDYQAIFDYPIPHVIARYCKDYGVAEEVAKVHERELKRWFILTIIWANKYPGKPLDMFSSEIDNLWHTFLLFTQDYQKFCYECFGKFIHHTPTIDTH